MKLIRYEDPVDGLALDLHSRLTLVSGLDADARQRLVDAVAALPEGSDPGARGSIEVHGVFLDLTRDSLELLELHEPLDVTVRAGDLPGSAIDVPAPPAELPARVTDRLATLAGERQRAEDELAAALEQRAAARRRHDELVDTRRRITADIEAARAGVDPAAAAELVRARDEFETRRRRSTAAALEELAARRAHLESQLEALITEADQQRRELKRLATSGTAEVREALRRAEESLDPELMPSDEAQQLAAQLEELDDRLAVLDSHAASGREQLLELTARRDAAYDELVAAEAALRSPDLDADAVAELEAVHDEIFELDGRGSKLSSSRLRRRMNELRDRERQLLDELGFDTWSSYVMGMSTDGAEHERTRRYEVAKATYEFAEDELAKAAVTPVRAGGELADARDERQRLLVRAAELLGRPVGPDPVAELRDHRIPVHEVDRAGALADLRGELVNRGIEEVPDADAALVEVARRWLADADAEAAARVREVEATREHIEVEITRLAAELEALPHPDDDTVGQVEDPGLAEAEAALEELQERVARHRAAQKLLDELRALDQVLGGDEDDVERGVAEADAAVREAERAVSSIAEAQRRAEDELAAARSAAEAPPPPADERRRSTRSARRELLDRVEWYVLARLAQLRSVSFVGSVPLVLDDAFEEWRVDELGEVLERLVRMSEVIQIIILSDDVDLAAWVRGLGRERAAVVDLAPVG